MTSVGGRRVQSVPAGLESGEACGSSGLAGLNPGRDRLKDGPHRYDGGLVAPHHEVELGSVKVRDLIRLIQSDGWRQVRTTGSHRHFKHSEKPNVVTVSGHLGDDMPPEP